MTDDATVLVVDDLPQNVRLLDAVLTPRGFRVVGVSSGEEALASLHEQVPDIVLLDIVMPGLDGYEVCRRLRKDPLTAFLPVVMITASGDQEKIAAIEAGADDFVAKPFDQAELLARVRSLVRVKRYHDTVERQKVELQGWNEELEQRVLGLLAEGKPREAAELAMYGEPKDARRGGHGERILGYLRGLARNEADSDDAFGDFAIDVVKGIRTFQGKSSL